MPPRSSAASGGPAPRARTIFIGSGSFAVPILHALLDHPTIAIVGIVAPPDRPGGRHGAVTSVPVAAEARARGITLLQPARVRAPEAAASIAALRPDLGVLADFGRIVPRAILEIPPHGILNVHPSLLPRHRGATPIPATLLEGDAEAGVTVMRMDEGLDTGPVVASRSWPLDGSETAPELEVRAATEGATLVARIVDPYLRGEAEGAPQDDAAATLTRPLRREDGRLDPNRSAVALERQVRAYLPWPGSWLETPDGRLAVLRAAVAPLEAKDVPGTLVADGTAMALVAADGRLRLLDVQPAGGRPMPADAFRRGHPRILNSVPVTHG